MRLIQSGPRAARIMIVGEAPGRQEDDQGLPFVGASGDLLNNILSRAGLPRASCFVTNVVHVRPPNNDFAWVLKKENQLHYLLGAAQLKKDIKEISPNIILALGANALSVLTGKKGIDKWRGSILPCTLEPGHKVVATYHPASTFRVYEQKTLLEIDVKRAVKESRYKDLNLPQRDHYLDPKEPLLGQLVAEMLKAELLAVDIECKPTSVPGKWELICVGFSDKPSRGLVIASNTHAKQSYIRSLLESDVPKVYQNGQFDVSFLRGVGYSPRNYAHDTMNAHHTLLMESATGEDELAKLTGRKRTSVFKKGLAFQTSIYTREPFYKDDSKVSAETGDKELFYLYNSRDACVTREIIDVQLGELIKDDLLPTYRHSMSLMEPLMEATAEGILIDLEAKEKFSSDLGKEVSNLQTVLNSLAGWEVNVGSSKDMARLLYDQLGFKATAFTPGGSPSADADAIVALNEKHKHPVLLTILAIRERRKIIEAYLNVGVDADSRMRCLFDPTGTNTGRLACRASLSGSGTNLQTIPAKLRKMFVADPGYVLLYPDYSQAEARVVAYLAEEDGLIELFEDPTKDVHKENAVRILNKRSVADVNDEERYMAKRTVHASNYGIKPPRFTQVVNSDAQDSWGKRGTGITITLKDAQRFIDGYFMTYPKIRDVFWREVEMELRQTRTLKTPFGRKRTFYARWDGNFLESAYAFKPQSTVGDLACMAFVNAWRTKKPTWKVLLNIHDALLLAVPRADLLEAVEWQRAAMDIPMHVKGRTLKIPTDLKVGYNWGDAAPDNPRGMRKLKTFLAEDSNA